jgi:hypothetical protein
VDVQSVRISYVRGYEYTLLHPPCSLIGCTEYSEKTPSPLGQYALAVHNINLFDTANNMPNHDETEYARILANYREDAFNECEMPSASKLSAMSRLEAAEQGADDACSFLESFGYADSCSGIRSWAKEEVEDNFAGYVNSLPANYSKCSSMAENLEW